MAGPPPPKCAQVCPTPSQGAKGLLDSAYSQGIYTGASKHRASLLGTAITALGGAFIYYHIYFFSLTESKHSPPEDLEGYHHLDQRLDRSLQTNGQTRPSYKVLHIQVKRGKERFGSDLGRAVPPDAEVKANNGSYGMGHGQKTLPHSIALLTIFCKMLEVVRLE